MNPTDQPPAATSPPRRHQPATWWTARIGLAATAALAAWASYTHSLPVIQAADGPDTVSYFLPALADLLIATAAAALLDARRRGAQLPRLSMLSVCTGVGMTITFNVASGSPHWLPPWLVNAWAPVAFLLALESFVSHVRRADSAPAPALAEVPAPPPAPCDHAVDSADSRPVQVANDYLHLRDCEGRIVSYRELGRRHGIHHRTARNWVESATASGAGDDVA